MGKITWIIGVDEVGRGPIAGPVAVCAVAMRLADYTKARWGILTDSKKMTSNNREEWYGKALVLQKEGAIHFAVSYKSNAYIDTKGISRAIRECVRNALEKLNLDPDECRVLLDGSLKAPAEYHNQKTIIRGDMKEKIISLASVIAKVSRDKKMLRLHKNHPLYGWNTNKGYGTALHYKGIVEYGLTDLHRTTFLTNVK